MKGRGCEVRVPGSQRVRVEVQLEGEGQESAEGVGEAQEYQGRPKKIGQAESIPAPGGLQAGGGPWAWECDVSRGDGRTVGLCASPPEVKRWPLPANLLPLQRGEQSGAGTVSNSGFAAEHVTQAIFADRKDRVSS